MVTSCSINKRNILLKSSIFIALGIVLFSYVQRMLVPNRNWPDSAENIAWQVKTFHNLREDSVDVLFLGTSHVKWGVSPVEIYSDYGIVSYNLSSSAQPIDISYYMLRDAFRYQSPSYVVIDASAFFYPLSNYDDSSRKAVLDELLPDYNKIEAALDYGAIYDKKNYNEKIERFNTIMFPIISYHTNWKRLSKGNFHPENDYAMAGYFFDSREVNMYTDEMGMNEVADFMVGDNIHRTISNKNGTIDYTEHKDVYYRNEVAEDSLEYIKKIINLCETNNCKLIITKIPAVNYPYMYNSSWTKYRYDATKELSEVLGVDYFDLLYDTDIQLMSNDYMDGGGHLNYNGASKVSKYLGSYLSKECGIEGKYNDYMEKCIFRYNKAVEVANLQMENDIFQYFTLLDERKENYIICVSVKEYTGINSADSGIESLRKVGLINAIDGNMDIGNSYLAVLDSGIIKKEELSNREISFDYNIDGTIIEIKSSGAFCGNKAKIEIDSNNASMELRGLNVVVLDKKSGKIIDSCHCDTSIDENHYLEHNGNCINYLLNYIYGEE